MARLKPLPTEFVINRRLESCNSHQVVGHPVHFRDEFLRDVAGVCWPLLPHSLATWRLRWARRVFHKERHLQTVRLGDGRLRICISVFPGNPAHHWVWVEAGTVIHPIMLLVIQIQGGRQKKNSISH